MKFKLNKKNKMKIYNNKRLTKNNKNKIQLKIINNQIKYNYKNSINNKENNMNNLNNKVYHKIKKIYKYKNLRNNLSK